MASLRSEVKGKAEQTEAGAQEKRDSLRAPAPEGETAAPEAPRVSNTGTLVFAVALAAFWLGASIAFLWGYFGIERLNVLGPHLLAFAAVVSFLPPFLFIASAFAFARARTMSESAHLLAAAAERLTHADDNAAITAQRLGRIVRRELDALNAGLDTAFGRMRALETALEERVAQLEDASARAGVKTEAIAKRLREERDGIENTSEALDQAAARASETLAGRAAQLKALMESAGGELKASAQLLEMQSAQFREATEKAAGAPLAAAVELDRQAKQIEAAADNAVSRAEFVLARQERQRGAMNDLMTRLKDEAAAFEQVLEVQQRALERAASQLGEEAKRLDEMTGEGLRRMDATMGNAAARSAQLASGFGKEAERVKEAAETAAHSISRLVDSLREASASAQALTEETAAQAKQHSKEFVGEAMGSSDQLLRAAASVAEEAEKARAALAKAAEDAQRHIVGLPGVAAQEAERIRETLRIETDKMLDMSARTLATLQSRVAARRSAAGETHVEAPPEPAGEGLRGLAKRMTAPKKKPEEKQARGSFQLSQVLAAAEAKETAEPALKSGTAAALGALQSALSDLAGDLDAAMGDTAGPELWRRYLDGDRGVFARKLANSIGPETVDRITQLYRDSPRFHEAADAYLQEFEALLARAREGDRDGFLASTLLSADTGKIYLAVAYALGRLD